MRYKSFEDFLQAKHGETYRGLDDDMSDAFEVWLGDLDKQELIDYADEYADNTRVEYLGHENKS